MYKKATPVILLFVVVFLLFGQCISAFASNEPEETTVESQDAIESSVTAPPEVISLDNLLAETTTQSPTDTTTSEQRENIQLSEASFNEASLLLEEDATALEANDGITEVPGISFNSVNPIYEDIAPYIAYPVATLDGAGEEEDIVYASTSAEAGVTMREAMKNREESFKIYWMLDDMLTSSSQLREVFTYALEHTGVGTEGDYIRWAYITFDAQADGFEEDGIYYYTISCVATYYTNTAQEAEMNHAVASLIAQLNLPRESDYENLRAIYDYMCENITYDYDNLNDSSYTLKYSAYAALINKTAVCQGYAALFYRLSLECGIDCRLIAGTGNNVNHGWVIAKLGDYYYNVDPTWDAGESTYSYFLCGSADFDDHTPFSTYTSSDFTAAYPIPETSYTYYIIGDVDSNGSANMQDIVRLLRALTGWDVVYDEIAADANEDAAADMRDAVIILRYASGWTEGVYRVGIRV